MLYIATKKAYIIMSLEGKILQNVVISSMIAQPMMSFSKAKCLILT